MGLSARLRTLHDPLRGLLAAAALGLLYLLLAYLGIALWGAETALLWPASGLYLGVLLACRRRLWPGLAAGVLAGSLGANLLAGNSPAVSLAFAVPSCAEGLLGAVLVLWLTRDRLTLERTRDVAALMAGGAVAATGLTALAAAVAAVQAFDAPLRESWLAWWAADALGVATVAPIVLLLLRRLPGRLAREQVGQAGLSIALLAGIVFFLSTVEPPVTAAVVAGMLGSPLLVWAAWRWSVRAVALLIPAVAIAVILVASREAGSLSGPLSSADMLVVQAFLATLVIATLTLGTTMAERHGAELALGRSREEGAQARAELLETSELLERREVQLTEAAERIERLGDELHHKARLLERVGQERARRGVEVERERAAAERRSQRLCQELDELRGELARGRARLDEVERERLLLARRGTELIARYDARGICLYASPACRELVGYAPEELLGRQGAELLHRDDMPLLGRARAAEGDTTFRARLRRKDGRLTAVEATFSPIRDVASGHLLEIEASVRCAPAARTPERVETLPEQAQDPAMAPPRPVAVVRRSQPAAAVSR